MIREATTEADLDAYVEVWNAITPEEPANVAQQRERRERDPARLYLLAELDPVAQMSPELEIGVGRGRADVHPDRFSLPCFLA